MSDRKAQLDEDHKLAKVIFKYKTEIRSSKSFFTLKELDNQIKKEETERRAQLEEDYKLAKVNLNLKYILK